MCRRREGSQKEGKKGKKRKWGRGGGMAKVGDVEVDGNFIEKYHKERRR